MIDGPWGREVAAGVGALREAVRLVSGIRRDMRHDALVKVDRSPVTVADFSVQAVVVHRLAAAFPGDQIVAEEDSSALRADDGEEIFAQVLNCVRRSIPTACADQVLQAIDRGAGDPADRFWTLDPIDGTKGFIRGEHFAIALSLIVDGCVQVGILACPHLSMVHSRRGTMAVAVRGQGAVALGLEDGDGKDRAPIRVSAVREPTAARVLRSRDPGHVDGSRLDRFVERLGAAVPPVPMDSQAKHAALAIGQADLMLRLPTTTDFRELIWDQAAGTLAIEEAGGCVTDLNGEPLDFGAGRTLARNTGIVASNRWLHQSALDAIRQSS